MTRESFTFSLNREKKKKSLNVAATMIVRVMKTNKMWLATAHKSDQSKTKIWFTREKETKISDSRNKFSSVLSEKIITCVSHVLVKSKIKSEWVWKCKNRFKTNLHTFRDVIILIFMGTTIVLFGNDAEKFAFRIHVTWAHRRMSNQLEHS